MKQILIKNAYLITMNGQREVYENGKLLIEDNKIKAVGNFDESIVSSGAEVYDAKGKILMPGLVNTHVHLSQQLGRGIADDVNLLTWLRERVWPYESSFDYEDSLISSTACCIELIRSGVTTFLESGGQYVDAMVEAVNKTGIRACLAKSVMDEGEGLPKAFDKAAQEELDTQEELYNKYNNTSNERVKIWFALRTIFNNSDELILKTKQLADKYKTGIHMHVAEIEDEVEFAKLRAGLTTVEHLNKLGVLDKNLLAVHTVWLTEREIELFRFYDVKVSHNPAAAMKVVLGFASVPEMLEKGIPVSIGTDGAPSNNRMDMMRDMYLTSLIHKGRTLNPEVVNAETVLEMATINGAKCALLEKEIGSLEVGKKADMIILNPNTIHSLPMHNPIGNIVYSMSSENIESTICDGKWLMKEKEILVLDEVELLEKVKNQAEKIRKKANINLTTNFKVIK
ncbi:MULTISPECIES: amidohydrolase [Romboutsia]|uniref:5-methylthioadenosine/S-adenosylhomocysteine deaminase n=1 Tax=Romboutsia hominis TaxID=1507512 RepID=A0A2P2BP40_9FIRM|nr:MULTISPECIES: amidohydrolase [Romboutsia]MCH1959204.1 amidohydrolase [Romboutsia hominis]MCH1970103.1 amidohydrolase [Romboutsia hominis]MDB8790319.1 amidohydrolase [Romboutsia sp. 1001216sp1]MDB8792248.1 amidohydrolase [Romboutsia sp. 1001216sp1]MDB8795542.1 amidohydrolase [Romboutsia sp. 1001216sp1]